MHPARQILCAARRFRPSVLWSRSATPPQRAPQGRRVPGAFNGVILVVFLAIAIVVPAVALAAPLTETEPNDTPLEANGPFGPDGFLSTIDVSGDVDDVIFRLEGERQVTLTLAAEAGCGKHRSRPPGHQRRRQPDHQRRRGRRWPTQFDRNSQLDHAA